MNIIIERAYVNRWRIKIDETEGVNVYKTNLTTEQIISQIRKRMREEPKCTS